VVVIQAENCPFYAHFKDGDIVEHTEEVEEEAA
jgi:hypothetical protein